MAAAAGSETIAAWSRRSRAVIPRWDLTVAHDRADEYIGDDDGRCAVMWHDRHADDGLSIGPLSRPSQPRPFQSVAVFAITLAGMILL
jgi:hypothetical protein